MIIKILGILDIFIGIVFWLFGIFNIIPSSFIFIIGLFLLIKGIVFIFGLSIVSALDIVSGIIIMAASATSIVMPNLVIILIAIFLIQKGIFSMLS